MPRWFLTCSNEQYKLSYLFMYESYFDDYSLISKGFYLFIYFFLYFRPELVDGETCLNIEQGRNPIVHMLLGETQQYVSNDTLLKVSEFSC